MNYFKTLGNLHRRFAQAHHGAAIAGHGDHHGELQKLHEELASLCDEMQELGGEGSTVPVGHDFKGFAPLDFGKRFGVDASSRVIPDGVVGVGLTEEAAKLGEAELSHVRLVRRPGQSEGGVKPDTSKLIEEFPALEKFV